MAFLENRCFIATVAIVGVVAIVVAIAVPIVVNNELESQLDAELIVTGPSSNGYDRFVDSRTEDGSPREVNIYVFNIDNPDGVLAGEKPILTEMGPYKFLEHNVRTNNSFSEDSGEFSYVPWPFKEELEQDDGLSLSDTFTTLNLVFQSVMYTTLDDDLFRIGLSLVYGDGVKNDAERLFVDVTVEEFLFGYLDTDLEILNLVLESLNLATIDPFYPGIVENVTKAEVIERHKPAVVKTGAVGPKADVGQFVLYDGADVSQYCPGGVTEPCPPGDKKYSWASRPASEIRGTDGQQFHRFVKKSDKLEVYVHEFGRVVNLLSYEEDDEAEVFGIKLLRFSTDPLQFQNSSINPANVDYFQDNVTSGLVNVHRQYEMRSWMSKPHFLDGDRDLVDRIESGINPVPELHQTFIDIEPTTGLTMQVTRSTQFNIEIEPVEVRGLVGSEFWFPDVQHVYMPIFWLQESADIPEDRATDFRDNNLPDIHLAMDVSRVTPYVAYPVGGVLLLAAPLLWIRRRRKIKKENKTVYSPLNTPVK